MKKYYFIVIAFAMTVLVSCGNQQVEQTEEGQTNDTTVAVSQMSPAAKTMDLAVRLARYGYENECAEALIGAADVMLRLEAEKMEVAPEKEGGEAPAEAPEAKAMDPATLIADAKALAGEDELLMKMIERVEQKMAASVDAATRGSESSSGYVTEYIYPHQSDVYKIDFQKNRAASVAVKGDGSTDLNLYIYDAEGNPIVNDMGPSDDCYCEWTPTKTGNYIIKIINRGNDNNQYTMYIER